MKVSELKKLIKEEIAKVLSENKFIEDFEEYIGDGDATEAVIDYFSLKNKLTPEQKSALKNKFLSKFSIKSTGPLPSDIKPRIGK
jgi:hypothetical protein